MENRYRWDSTGTYLGNYTDTRLSLDLNLDLLNLDIDLPAQLPHSAVRPLATDIQHPGRYGRLGKPCGCRGDPQILSWMGRLQ